MNNQKPKIFLSYAREDMGMVKKLYNDLKRYGLDVWLDTESLLPGDRWKDKIQDAIENSNYFIALLSSRSVNKKGFVQKELKTALEVLDLFPSSERFILPVRLDDCEICERKMKEHHWVDLFPEIEYQNGLKKILKVVYKEALLLRSKPATLSEGDTTEMIRRFGFYDRNKNPESAGFYNKYELQEIDGKTVIFEESTGLIWQQSGTSKTIKYNKIKSWINELNQNKFAGFDDWRLPTLEEAMSLLESMKKHNLYINPIFDSKQRWIWTADTVKDEQREWVVLFYGGCCSKGGFSEHPYARAVRSGESSKNVKAQTKEVEPKQDIIKTKITVFRSNGQSLSGNDIINMLKKYDFIDHIHNANSMGFNNAYEQKTINGDEVVIDNASELMWQQSGSSNNMTFVDVSS